MPRFAPFVVVLTFVLGACSFSPGTSGGNTGGTGNVPVTGLGGLGGFGGGTGTAGGPGIGSPCTNLTCQQPTCVMGSCAVPACTGGAKTTISGIIRDPAGMVPLYNITVYVPNKAVDPIADGPSCDPCDPRTGTSLLSGEPIAIAKTDVSGAFTLGEMPVGTNIPVVIQVGKWRREITIDNVNPCVDNPISNTDLLRLPRNQSEGHIPKMALTTGSADVLECLLRKVGISDSEFTPETGNGRINFYAGGGGTNAYDASLNGGAAFTAAQPFWDSLSNMQKYDIVLLSCEGQQGSFSGNQAPMYTKSTAARQALLDFANMGGRVFASHWHVYWFERGPNPLNTIATFSHRNGLPNPYNATVDNATLAQWLVNVGGSTTLGILPLAQDANQTTVDMVTGGNTSQRWIYAADRNPQAVQYMTATTPIPGGTCGRVVLSDIHVSNGGMGTTSDMPNTPFPRGCVTTTLSPQEKALEFMLFDIASCVGIIVP